MAKVILSRRKRAHQPRAPHTSKIETAVQLAQIRLRRAQDVLSALAFCADQEAELSLGPVAVAARDQIDRALNGLTELVKGRKNPLP